MVIKLNAIHIKSSFRTTEESFSLDSPNFIIPIKILNLLSTFQDNSIKNEDIVVNASYYKISPNISQQMRAYAETQTTYAADPQKCRHLDCMTKDKLLFDLSWDVTESNDLSWRFSAETDELYETLRTYSNRTHVPVQPKFFEDQNEEAKIDDVWTPWLLNSTEV